MSWLQRIGRALVFFIPDNVLIGMDWEVEQKRVARLRADLKACGNGVSFGRNVMVRTPGSVTVGSGCHLNDFVHVLGAGGVELGNHVFIANHASIISLTHPVDVDSLAVAPGVYKPVVIEDDVWIGAHAVILPGVRLGRSCVIAAGAVVTRDVEPFAIVGGVPARLIRRKEMQGAATVASNSEKH
jgi:acetyltransferase-like isoleucine patch superfamily enzyme